MKRNQFSAAEWAAVGIDLKQGSNEQRGKRDQ